MAVESSLPFIEVPAAALAHTHAIESDERRGARSRDAAAAALAGRKFVPEFLGEIDANVFCC